MGLRHEPHLQRFARLGEDLRAALAYIVTHRRVRQLARAVFIDQPGQHPSRRVPLLLRGIQIRPQHRIDRTLVWLQPRRDPQRGLPRRRHRRLQGLAHRAPMHTMPAGQRPNRQLLNPMIAADRRKQLHL